MIQFVISTTLRPKENKAMETKRSKEFTLVDIARLGAIGPIESKANMSKLCSIMLPPDYWGFSDIEKPFASWMDFGDVEVGFSAEKSIVHMDYAKFYMANFDHGRLKFYRRKRRSRTVIVNNFRGQYPTFSVVSSVMNANTIKFIAKVVNFVSDETWGVMEFGKNLKFYLNCKSEKSFLLEKSRLNFVEIGR